MAGHDLRNPAAAWPFPSRGHKQQDKIMERIESPDNSDRGIEREIQAKGKTAPRVTPQDIADKIASEHYFTALQGAHGEVQDGGNGGIYRPDQLVPNTLQALGLLTFCVLVLRNGFTITGESACASPENFDAEIGKRIARENAVQKVWPLMGYQLKEQLYQRTQPMQAPE